jgi:hypothetical protein
MTQVRRHTGFAWRRLGQEIELPSEQINRLGFARYPVLLLPQPDMPRDSPLYSCVTAARQPCFSE